MSESAAPKPAPTLPMKAREVLRAPKTAVSRLPLKIWIVVAAGIVLGVLSYLVLTSGSAKLKVAVRHGFRNGEISVLVDGTLVYNDQLTANAKKRLGIFGKTGGSFSKTLSLPAGQHVVQVRINSPAERYDQSKRCGVNLIRGKEAMLSVAAERAGMSLAYQGPPITPMEAPSSDYTAVARSLLITASGSVFSAVIGFLVQDFLRTRKARRLQNANQT